MAAPERPQLRPHLAASPADRFGRQFVLWDQLRLSRAEVRVSPHELDWAELFDGSRTLRDIQSEAIRRAGGQLLPLGLFASLADRLDRAVFLDGERFRELAASPVRPPVCLHRPPEFYGSYPADPDELRRELAKLFTLPGGPGLPGNPRPDDSLRAALVPHMDYARGGATYAWGFKEVAERTPAALFVIVGTSHHSPRRFTLTRKHFQTPLGLVETDRGYVDRLVAHYGGGLFDDELRAHLPEHSIELEVVLLQYLFEGRRPFRIVPLVVGSFHDAVATGLPPRALADVGRMVEALRAAERETAEPVCYLISGDLAHLGPKFGDRRPVEAPLLTRSGRQDQALLKKAERADALGYFRVIADEADARRICGLPPTYTVLEALRPSSGRVLHYSQYVDPTGEESVSFASMVFER